MPKQRPLRPYRPDSYQIEHDRPYQRPVQRLKSIIYQTFRWTFRLSTLLILLGVSSVSGAFFGMKKNFQHLPPVSKLEYYAPVESTEIFDEKGTLLFKRHGEENRKVVALQDIPGHVQRAVIAAEDARFYEHQGIDIKGLVRALKVNFDKGAVAQGGSSITQQVVKNLFLTPERTVQRKLAEMWMAVQVEQRYSKAQILELYLNQVYWGHNAYGIQAAATNYFGKPVQKLSLAEGALLAGLLTGPELYSPYHNAEAAQIRQKLTLERMVDTGQITPAEKATAEKQKLTYPGIRQGSMKSPYFTSYVLAVLKQNYGNSLAYKNGLKVYTTLNADWQKQGESMLKQHVNAHRRSRVSEAAMVAIENKTGFVRAIIGGTGYEKSQFNRAWQAQRQPGSAFKPFVYLTAFARGYRPEHIEIDEPIRYRRGSYIWKPKNYAGGHSGPMTLQRALERSNNIIAVKLAERVGNGSVIETAHRLGIRSPLRNVLSLALGPSEVTPLEMASAYRTIAEGGDYLEPTPILWIEDRFGNIIEDNRHRQAENMYSRSATEMLIPLMVGVIERGTAPQARIGRQAAGKTGTTSDNKDAWFVGFTPDITTAVWVGNDKPQTLYGATGGRIAAPLWARFMRYMHKGIPPHKFEFIKGLPVFKGIPISSDETGDFQGQYERLSPSSAPSVDPFLSNPESFSVSTEDLDIDLQEVPVALPSSAQLPPNNAPINGAITTPDQRTRSQDKKVVSELDQLLKELDRLEVPTGN